MKKKRTRLLITIIIMIILLFAIITKLTYIKIIKSEEYYDKAIDLWTRSAPIRGARGSIYDCNGELIVGNYITPTIVSIPKQIDNPARTSSAIANILHVDSNKILKHLTKNVSVEIIKPEGQKLDVTTAIKVARLNLKGIYVVGDTSRYYPYQSTLSQVIGITGIDNQGITGLEAIYDQKLKGEYGALQVFTDAHGNDIIDLTSLYAKAESGCDIYLTIDLNIQLSLERVLSNAMENYQAKEVSGIVINPKTSEVLAMACLPTFDPARYQEYDLSLYNRNIPIWKVYEPGSTFKICTFAAGLEENVFSLDEIFYDPGYALVDGARLRDWKLGGHGKETFREVLQNSCNPGFVTIGLRLGKDKFFHYMKEFGFGSKTGIDLLGESSGIIFNPDNIGNVELATSAFGQGNAVTMLQLINAASAAVNGGVLHQPYVLKSIKKGDEVLLENTPKVIRRVISSETSRKVAESLECVVALGTGRGSYIEGYRVGGKTGVITGKVR
ncbi:MAG: stage V sporulation protein D [Mollicutes bacterium]|nr:stage V sporulation protein D [Mollicutes bacterium]